MIKKVLFRPNPIRPHHVLVVNDIPVFEIVFAPGLSRLRWVGFDPESTPFEVRFNHPYFAWAGQMCIELEK